MKLRASSYGQAAVGLEDLAPIKRTIAGCNSVQEMTVASQYSDSTRGVRVTLNIRRCREDEQTELLRIINSAAQRYQGVIPDNCWHEPYMTANELTAEIAAGVQFWGAEFDGVLMGIMGIQQVRDADLIRHAYVLPAVQGKGIGGGLLKGLCSRMSKPLLIGTWSAASWAIDFYVRHGFRLVGTEEARKLLKTYWTIPDRQIEASVVLKQG